MIFLGAEKPHQDSEPPLAQGPTSLLATRGSWLLLYGCSSACCYERGLTPSLPETAVVQPHSQPRKIPSWPLRAPLASWSM